MCWIWHVHDRIQELDERNHGSKENLTSFQSSKYDRLAEKSICLSCDEAKIKEKWFMLFEQPVLLAQNQEQ